MTSGFFVRALRSIALGSALSLTWAADARPQDTTNSVLHAAGLERGANTHSRAEVVRHRAVRIDLDTLARVRPGQQELVTFDLFDGVSLTGEVRRKTNPGAAAGHPNAFALSGPLVGDVSGEFNLVVHQGVVSGIFTLPGERTYQLRHLGNGLHEACELDFSGHAGCGVTEAQEVHLKNDDLLGPAGPTIAADSAGADDGSLIDMMVIYTDDVRISLGSTAAAETEVMLAINVSNTAYDNSLITTQMRLVHTSEVLYSETANGSTDLNALTMTNDGILDGIHAIRDSVAADNVSLFAKNIGTGLCGIAWIMSTNTATFESASFNVCDVDCAVGNRTFPHEVGHNQGCAHERAAGGSGVFSFSFGYMDAPTFRTIMHRSSSSAPRVGHISNPNVTFAGLPTGIADTQSDSADNAQSINITRLTMAQFRTSICPIPEPTFDCNFNCIEDADDITAGTELDCNGNAIPDACELSAGTVNDCDLNGIPDVCEDCNNNGIGDACEFSGVFTDNSPVCSPFGLAFPPVECGIHTIVSPSLPLSDVTFTFSAMGPLSSALKTITVTLNGNQLGPTGVIFVNGSECPVTPDVEQVVITAAEFLTLTGGGDAVIEMSSTDILADFDCGGATSIAVTTSYDANTGTTGDVNENGIPDECDLARGDSNLDGIVGIVDFLAVLAKWGLCPAPCPEDANLSGSVGINDFLNVLANWG